MEKIRILVILSVALLIFGGLVTQGILASGDQPEGKPFQALWDAIQDLDDRVTSEVSRLDGEIDDLDGRVTSEVSRLDERIDATMPVGAIIMWSGTIDGNGNPVVGGTSNTNWYICDGTYGTPDLRDRFIVGSGDSYAIGATGGLAMVTLDISQMPRHRHHYSGITASAGGHRHTYDDRYSYGSEAVGTGFWYAREDSSTTASRTTSWAGAHSHSYSGYTNYQGQNAAHENRPPYYALAYIMRVQ